MSSSDLNQAVTITLDPPLRISNCHCWQLLRNHNSEDEDQGKSYTIDDSENLAFYQGFVLVAMNADGSKCFPDDSINNNTKNNDDDQGEDNGDTKFHEKNEVEFYFAAPNPNIFVGEVSDGHHHGEKRTPLVLTKPLMKNAVILVPHYYNSSCSCSANDASSPQKNLFSWNVTRFPGGGISFHTTLEKVAAWFNLTENKKLIKRNAEPIGYYLTDDARLLSEELIEGPVGFGMNLAYPPVVDVTCLLDQKNRSQNTENDETTISPPLASSPSSSSTLIRSIERTRRFLIDAAGDCGFFYSVVRQKSSSSIVVGFELENDNNISCSLDFISSNDAHSASQRLMQMIRNVFGRSISAKAKPSTSWANPHFNNCFPIDEQLTKVTLKSTTGEVKTSFNPPRFAKIELPEWMQNICDENENNENMKLVEKCCQNYFDNEFVPAHFRNEESASFSQQTARIENNNTSRSDLETHFSFGEELAARIIGMLLRGADAKISTQWPTKEMIENHPKTYKSIQVTNIREGEVRNISNSIKLVSIPRVEPSELYTLFRSVCYPPSTRKHDKKLKKLEQLVNSSSQTKSENGNTNGNLLTEEDEENVEYVYEEVEEEEETEGEEMKVENDNDEKSSHKSSDTDDSQGKALYEHTDKTWITLLIASPSLHGLEVVDIDGSTFTECCVPKMLAKDNFNHKTRRNKMNAISENDCCEGKILRRENDDDDDERVFAFICNIGDALQMVSNGKYISRTHRARNPNLNRGVDDGGNSGLPKKNDDDDHAKVCCCQDCRISLPLFVEPSPHRWPLS